MSQLPDLDFKDYINSLTAATANDLKSGNNFPLVGDAPKKIGSDFVGGVTHDVSSGGCVAYLEGAGGGGITFSYRCVVANQGTVAGIAVATYTNGGSSSYVKINYIQGLGSKPFVLKNDGTRTAIVSNLPNTSEIRILSKGPNWKYKENGGYPESWNSASAVEIGPCDPFIEPSGIMDSVASGDCIAYLTGNTGGSVYIAYRGNVNADKVDGIACVTFTASSTTERPYFRKITFFNTEENSILPFKMMSDGTRTAIISQHSQAIGVIFRGDSWIVPKNWSMPPSWDSTHETDIGSYEFTKCTNSVSALSSSISSLMGQSGVVGVLNGGVGNRANTYKVRSSVGVDVRDATAFRLVTNRPARENCIYKVGFILTADSAAIGHEFYNGSIYPVSVNRGDSYYYGYKMGEFIDLSGFPGNAAIAVEWMEWDTVNNVEKVLRVADFEGYSAYIERGFSEGSDVVNLYSDYAKYANACARIRKSSDDSKNFGLLIVTDSHTDDNSVKNAVEIAGGFRAVDCLIHCGDFVGSYVDRNSVTSTFASLIDKSQKPVYFVMGNHEKGTFKNIRYTPTDSQLYNLFVKPIVDKGWLANGEFVVNKCYYFHDFSATKTRLIVLDEYEAPFDIDETYWRAVTYDSSFPAVADSTNYSVGDKVNVPGYTDYSFEAVQSVNTGTYYSGKYPSYKCRRGYRYISETQAQWFLDTLATTPDGYSTIVALHNPFSDIAETQNSKKFCQTDYVAVGSSDAQNLMATDFIADAVNAFKNKQNYSATISTKSGGEGAYIQPYSVSKDFSGIGNSKFFSCLIGGHCHRDLIWRHPTYGYQFQVSPIDSNTTYYGQDPNADIRKDKNSKTKYGVDSLTFLSVELNRIALCKIGVNVTDIGEMRDIEVWNPNA